MLLHSYEIAKKLGKIYDLQDIPELLRSSRERYDGKGYPDGLSGHDIPLLSRILFIANAVNSMLTNTVQRKALQVDRVAQELVLHSGDLYDGELVQIAVSLLIAKDSDYLELFEGIGNYVTLNLQLQQDEPHNVWGYLKRRERYFDFFPNTPLPEMNRNQITGIYLYTNVSERIQKYKPDLKAIYQDKLVFSGLSALEHEKAFSIGWSLSGFFVTESKNPYQINIVNLGGDFVDFYLFKEELAEPLGSG
jgi:hypothetical protein